MIPATVVRAGAVLFALSMFAAAPPALGRASTPPAELPQDPPVAPAFDGWVIKSDTVIPREQVDQIQSKLGAKIKAMRVVNYDVASRKVQLNVIVAGDPASGDKIYSAMLKAKASYGMARKGDVIYEFVGQNDSIDDIKKAREKLIGP